MDWALDDGAFREWIARPAGGIWGEADAARERGALTLWIGADSVSRLARWIASERPAADTALGIRLDAALGRVSILTIDAATCAPLLSADADAIELGILSANLARLAPEGRVLSRRASTDPRVMAPEAAWESFATVSGPRRVPMLDLRAEYRSQAAALDHALLATAAEAHYILGPAVERFESELAAWLGARHAIGVSSGTEALVLSLRALALSRFGKERFEPGDRIATTPFTFVATGDAILRAGATPLFIDVDPVTLNMDVDALERALAAEGDRVVGIVPVHLFGLPCRMDRILEIARSRKLFVLEDVAQSFGAASQGKKTGTLGESGSFSFFPSKNLGGFGDAGAVATNDDALAEAVRMLLKHGGRDKNRFEVLGYNARLDSLQAAVLREKLPRTEANNARRRAVARRYLEGLEGLGDLRLPAAHDAGSDSVFHQFTLRTARREGLQAHLEKRGIACMRYYPYALHRMPLFDGRCRVAGGAGLPNAEAAAETCLSLPIGPAMTDAQADAVIDAVRAFFA